MRAAGRLAPVTHRPQSATSWIGSVLSRVPVVGSLVGGPTAHETVFDRITTAVTGTFLDPATRMGAPPQTPADWKTPDGLGDVKYSFYTEGINAGFVRGTAFGGAVVGACLAAAWHLRRKGGA